MKPHLPWVTLTSTAVVIPMPASTAIRGGAKRPDTAAGQEPGWRLEPARPGSRGQGPSHPLAELPGRQPACLEVLAQVRHDRITVGIGSPHFSRKIFFVMAFTGLPPFCLVPSCAGLAYIKCRKHGLSAPLPDATSER